MSSQVNQEGNKACVFSIAIYFLFPVLCLSTWQKKKKTSLPLIVPITQMRHAAEQ